MQMMPDQRGTEGTESRHAGSKMTRQVWQCTPVPGSHSSFWCLLHCQRIANKQFALNAGPDAPVPV